MRTKLQSADVISVLCPRLSPEAPPSHEMTTVITGWPTCHTPPAATLSAALDAQTPGLRCVGRGTRGSSHVKGLEDPPIAPVSPSSHRPLWLADRAFRRNCVTDAEQLTSLKLSLTRPFGLASSFAVALPWPRLPVSPLCPRRVGPRWSLLMSRILGLGTPFHPVCLPRSCSPFTFWAQFLYGHLLTPLRPRRHFPPQLTPTAL